MGKLNWDRVRQENLMMRRGSEFGGPLSTEPRTSLSSVNGGTRANTSGHKVCPDCNQQIRATRFSKHRAQCCKAAKTPRTIVVPARDSRVLPMQLLLKFEKSLHNSNIQQWTISELISAKKICVGAMQHFERLIAARRKRTMPSSPQGV
jgi:hypothetical protein